MINTFMRFQEFNPLKPFKAQVRLKTDKSLVLTLVWADSQHSARRNLSQLYGTENVLNVSQITLTEAKQITAQDQQIKTLKDRAKQITQQAKLTNARKSVTKAQQQLTKATAPAPISSQQ
jgi:hypothetical protein